VQLNAQLNTFNKQVLYKYWNQPFVEISALQQTTDRGYVSCRAVLDSNSGNGYHYCEFIKSDREGNPNWIKRVLMGAVPDSMMITSANIIQTLDKGYLGAMSKYKTNKFAEIVLIKTDSSGNLV
jgi:hypothetical protein